MKTVLISGGSSGLGLGLCNYLYNLSYNVISFSRRDIDCPWKHFSNIDASSLTDLKLLNKYLSECDCLINNVGMAYDGILATQGDSSIESMLDINLKSVILLTKFWIRARMQKRLSGSCVTISSIISNNGFKGLSVYSATKGALNSFTKSLAREMGSENFRFNAVLPGYFNSELSSSLSDQKKQQIIKRTPLKRLAELEDIMPLIEFLINDKSKFITGQLISVDGGLTC